MMFRIFLRRLRTTVLGLGLGACSCALQGQTVVNAGHGGDSSKNLLKRLDSDALSHHPSLVILLVGTNDALNHRNSVELDEYRTNLKTLIERIRYNGASILLLTPPPCNSTYVRQRHPVEFFQEKDPNTKLDDIRAVERSVAVSENIPIVELEPVFGEISKGEVKESLLRNKANSNSEDGLHPTASGYQAIAQAVAAGIAQHGLPTKMIVCFGDSITYGVAVKGAGTALGETYPGRLADILKSGSLSTIKDIESK